MFLPMILREKSRLLGLSAFRAILTLWIFILFFFCLLVSGPLSSVNNEPNVAHSPTLLPYGYHPFDFSSKFLYGGSDDSLFVFPNAAYFS